MLAAQHNRYDIYTRHGIKFRTVKMVLADEEAAMDWMDANQLARRNLTPDQRSLLRGRRYNRTKKQGVRKDLTYGQSDQKITTAQTLAEQHGVSEKTIRRDGRKADQLDALAKVDQAAAQAVMDGKQKFNEVKPEMKKAQLANPVEKPSGRYRVIYADPPWSYNDKCDAAGRSKVAVILHGRRSHTTAADAAGINVAVCLRRIHPWSAAGSFNSPALIRGIFPCAALRLLLGAANYRRYLWKMSLIRHFSRARSCSSVSMVVF